MEYLKPQKVNFIFRVTEFKDNRNLDSKLCSPGFQPCSA